MHPEHATQSFFGFNPPRDPQVAGEIGIGERHAPQPDEGGSAFADDAGRDVGREAAEPGIAGPDERDGRERLLDRGPDPDEPRDALERMLVGARPARGGPVERASVDGPGRRGCRSSR